MRRGLARYLAVLLMCLAVPSGARGSDPGSLDAGYRLMYSFDFTAAEREFDRWSVTHPDHPLGPASRAANLLVSELWRLGILDAQFFASDASFTRTRRVEADRDVRVRFESALSEASDLAGARLRHDADDPDALFAMAMVSGLRADYAALVAQRTMASLSYTREAVRWSDRVTAIAPDWADARLASGISQYVVGSLVAPVRWVLRLGGYSGSKSGGMEQVRLVAEHGRLFAPFARILLGIAYVRDGDRGRAVEVLAGLCRDFPSNPLFPRELRRLSQPGRP
jgi:hypothetical protein